MTESQDASIFSLACGSAPLLISIPHLGTRIPDDIAATMTEVARHADDTDWHLDRLYSFAAGMGASILTPIHSRYVIDLNRPPDDINLYPGRNTTGLLPTDTFDEAPLYREGCMPDEQEKARRRSLYWEPYHQALAQEIERIRAQHGYVLLWEAHSIRSQVPRLFEGRLPDFNFGTADGASALPGVIEKISADINARGQFSAVANGRFKGGYITRRYGDPGHGIHAIQLEMAQLTYMSESRPYAYRTEQATQAAHVVRKAIDYALSEIGAQYAR
ncbi:N-formylglutamate deformylase [Allopusillimonas soli]|uniref:N-formylglutamate deformylase n=1 Tax=Allopusillimonas soli TaxID=659016 RepID=A0A853FJ26_9BURK|nr:N-formylglutamate deformylase [Allopusillimonas soli]NYT37956.1 N-formylglutamate deformylase [Allopusillimonas soli]TEA73853.1 N-formylglutamate deformylase [Allopusillimonas soli]